MADHSTRTVLREYPGPRPVGATSDDLWNALYAERRTACVQHSAWVDHCKHLHQRADEQLAVAS